jgi:hypothetical protein
VVLLRDCATIRRTSTGIALDKLLRLFLIGLADLLWRLHLGAETFPFASQQQIAARLIAKSNDI